MENNTDKDIEIEEDVVEIKSDDVRKENINLKKELETYKKIAEKLAEYFIDYVKSNVRIENYIPPTIEELLDWARKEVENE